MKRVLRISFVIALCLMVGGIASAGEVMFNYQGHLSTQGAPFDGTGLFKFSILAKEGDDDYILWVNDGYTIDTQPNLSVAVEVDNGFFSVMIGDTSIPYMAPLEASIFNTDAKVCFRTWFSDGIGEFEQMVPDKQISNPELIGLEQEDEALTIYVNAVTGNDNNSGLNEEQPKKTIQGGVDAIPTMVTNSVTILVAPGVYRERVLMKNMLLSTGEASITITGDTETPSNVRVTGSDEGDDTTAVREYVFDIENTTGLVLEGLLIDRAADRGVLATRSSITIRYCAMQNNYQAVEAVRNSFLEMDYVEVRDSARGIGINHSSTAEIYYCTIENITEYHGVYVRHSSQVLIDNTTITDAYLSGVLGQVNAHVKVKSSVIDHCAFDPSGYHAGVLVHENSSAQIYGTTLKNSPAIGAGARRNSYIYFPKSTPSTIQDNGVGVEAEVSSTIEAEGASAVTFTGNGTDVVSNNNSYTMYVP